MGRWWRECAWSARPPPKYWLTSGTDSGRTPMGKKPNMSSKHQTPDQPVPGAEKRRQGVLDTRASSADDPLPGCAPPHAAGPELPAARDEAQATFARYQRLGADVQDYKRPTMRK